MKAMLLVVLAGCYGVESTDGTWEPVETIDGILTPEVGGPPMPHAAPPNGVLRIASWNTERMPDPELLARDLGMTFVFAPARREGYLHGVCMFSRYPIVNARVMKLPLGTAAFNQNLRNALAAEIDLGGTMITVVDMHLDVRLGPVDRIRQMHPAVMQTPERVAIGGDFNTNPWAWVGSTVPLTSTEAIVGQDQAHVIDDYMADQGFQSPISPDAVTFNRPLLDNMRLDNVFVRGYEVLGSGIAKDVLGSDHWPVWVDLML
jgi:endonuclease/exonuclease/phosphatase family metal-dependent hydrolase